MLRQFLYRDDALIREFLAQAEGGIVDQNEVRERGESGGSVGGSLGVGPAQVSGDKKKGRSEENARTVKQTGASEFDRLYRTLQGEDDLQYLEAIDEGIWEQLQRGEIIEAEVVVRPTGLAKISELFASFQEIAPAVAAASDDFVDVDAEGKAIFEMIASLSSVSSRGDTAPYVAALAGAPEYRFATDLRVASVVGSLDTLEGEATVCAKLQRKLRKDETYMMPAVFGGLEQMLDEEALISVSNVFNEPAVAQLGLTSPRLSYPGAILTPIAIYR